MPGVGVRPETEYGSSLANLIHKKDILKDRRSGVKTYFVAQWKSTSLWSK